MILNTQMLSETQGLSLLIIIIKCLVVKVKIVFSQICVWIWICLNSRKFHLFSVFSIWIPKLWLWRSQIIYWTLLKWQPAEMANMYKSFLHEDISQNNSVEISNDNQSKHDRITYSQWNQNIGERRCCLYLNLCMLLQRRI